MCVAGGGFVIIIIIGLLLGLYLYRYYPYIPLSVNDVKEPVTKKSENANKNTFKPSRRTTLSQAEMDILKMDIDTPDIESNENRETIKWDSRNYTPFTNNDNRVSLPDRPSDVTPPPPPPPPPPNGTKSFAGFKKRENKPVDIENQPKSDEIIDIPSEALEPTNRESANGRKSYFELNSQAEEEVNVHEFEITHAYKDSEDIKWNVNPRMQKPRPPQTSTDDPNREKKNKAMRNVYYNADVKSMAMKKEASPVPASKRPQSQDASNSTDSSSAAPPPPTPKKDGCIITSALFDGNFKSRLLNVYAKQGEDEGSVTPTRGVSPMRPESSESNKNGEVSVQPLLSRPTVRTNRRKSSVAKFADDELEAKPSTPSLPFRRSSLSRRPISIERLPVENDLESSPRNQPTAPPPNPTPPPAASNRSADTPPTEKTKIDRDKKRAETEKRSRKNMNAKNTDFT